MELVSKGVEGIIAIGECMIELSRAVPGGEAWRLRHAGDTLNTAVYLARLGENVAYLTALGIDDQSAAMRAEWQAEGIDTSLVLTVADRLPGLYLIETDARGDRHFHYWRERSAARALFSASGIASVLARAESASLLYLSGITLAILDDAGRARLRDLCAAVRVRGGDIAFDPNYRPRLWLAPDNARRAFADFGPLVSIALPTLDDEKQLYGDRYPDDAHRRWSRWGAREIAVKLGARGVEVFADGKGLSVPCQADANPRDTTGAGDAFNAGYLAARRRGLAIEDAAIAGNRLATTVVRHPGAIVQRAVMPSRLIPSLGTRA